MADGDPGDEISRLEAHIEALAAKAEMCRKIILFSKIAIAVGTVLLLAIMVRAIRFNPLVMISAMTAVIGGTVMVGANTSTAKQTAAAMQAAEARRAELIGSIDLRLIGDSDGDS
jgi:hypothetical protein